MSFGALDPDTAQAVLALSIASGLSPQTVVQRLLDTPPATASRQQHRPPRWPVVATATAGLTLLLLVARRARHA